MQGNAYIPLSEILTQAAQELRDPEFTKATFPFYESAAQTALTELNYSAPFFKKEFTVDIPQNRIIELPCDLTAKDQVYLFNGDSCNVASSPVLFIKPNFMTLGGTGSFQVNNGSGGGDLSQWPYALEAWVNPPFGCFYYAGERMGKLYLSQSCCGFQKVFIPYTGIGMDYFGADFVVPLWARRAIVDKVVLAVAISLEQDNLQFYRGVIARKEGQVNPGNPNGSWCAAIGIWNRMDPKEYSDLMAQTTFIGHRSWDDLNGGYGY